MTTPNNQFLSRRERRAAEEAAAQNAPTPSPFDEPIHTSPPAPPIQSPDTTADDGAQGDAADVFFQAPATPAVASPAPVGRSAPDRDNHDSDAAAFFDSSAPAETDAPAPTFEAPTAPPKRPEPKPAESAPTKGVNLWAAISLTAVVVSGVLSFTPPLAETAPYMSYVAVPLAIVAILLPGFKRLQSVIALVAALALGGWNAYGMFLVPSDEVVAGQGQAAGAPSTLVLLADGAGAGTVSWTVSGPADDATVEMPARDLPARAPIQIADINTATITVTVTAPDATDVSCSIADGPVDLVSAPADEAGVAVCVVEPRATAGDVAPAEEPTK